MAADPLLKRLQSAVRLRIHPLLRRQGFTEFTATTAYRRSERALDVVLLSRQWRNTLDGRARLGWVDGKEAYTTSATFQLSLGTYFLDTHRLPWVGPWLKNPRLDRCDRRLHMASTLRPGNIGDTVFWVDPKGTNFDQVIDDALAALETRAPAWFARNHEFSRLAAEGLAYARGELGLPDYEPESAETAARLPPDHEPSLPYVTGDALLGLLIGEGRWDDALSILKREADPEEIERWYRERVDQADRKALSYERKWQEKLRLVAESHLHQLAALRDGASPQG
jgi:hypothetical protein